MRSTAWRPRRTRSGLKKCLRHRERLAKCIRRAIHWIGSSRVFRSRDRVQRSGPAASDDPLLLILRTVSHALVAAQRHADPSSGQAARQWRRRCDSRGRWPASSVRTTRGLNVRSAASSKGPTGAHRYPDNLLQPRQLTPAARPPVKVATVARRSARRILSTHTGTTCATDDSVCRPALRFDSTHGAHITGWNVLIGGPIDFLVGTGKARQAAVAHPQSFPQTVTQSPPL
jgi:hypothetical protein